MQTRQQDIPAGQLPDSYHAGRETAAKWPLLVFALLVTAHLGLNLGVNGGHFTYTLDDAYIHLALAENFAHTGTYGINPGEYAAPSSSIIWPFLLAPFTLTPLGPIIPLLLNIIFGGLTVLLFFRIARIAFAGIDPATSARWAAGIAVLLIPATNVIGLIFTGMEHSLQVCLAAAIVYGLIVESRTGRFPSWLPIALVLGPLVRYEMFALTLPALVLLLVRRHVRTALAAGLTLIILVGSFSLFLSSRNLGLLPTSLFAKSDVISSGGALGTIFSRLRGNIISEGSGLLLAVSMLFFLTAAFRRSTPDALKALAGWGAAAVLVHLMFGRFGWYHRYEIYIWCSALLLVLYLGSASLIRLFRDTRAPFLGVTGVLAVLVIAWPYAHVLTDCHIAASNIYQQQFQMHRFATEYYAGPVAVNDIGCVSYANDNYVVDLMGLSDPEILRERSGKDDLEWMDQAARAHDARCAMVYDTWFERVPTNWVLLADLRLGHRLVSAGGTVVEFYALDDQIVDSLKAALARFAPTLPRGVKLEMHAPE